MTSNPADNPAEATGAGEPAHTPGVDRPDIPTMREITDLLTRLRAVSGRGAGADPTERAAFLADKHALIARIEAAQADTGRETSAGPPDRLRMPQQQRADAVARLAQPLPPDDPAEIAARITELRTRIAAPAAADAGPEVIGLVCPECGEDAIDRPPTTLVPYASHGMDRPDYSHPDGEPLCPVIGPHGYQPAEPVEVLAREPTEQIAAAHDAVTQALTDPARPQRANDRVDPDAFTNAAPRPAIGAALDRTGTRPTHPDERARCDQLTRWHHDDADHDPAHDAAPGHERGPERGDDDGLGA